MLPRSLRSRGDRGLFTTPGNSRRPRQRGRLFLLMALPLLVILSIPATPVSADNSRGAAIGAEGVSVNPSESKEGAENIIDTGSADGLLEMARLLATEFDVSVQAAFDRLKHQEAVAPLTEKWRRQHSTAFGGAYHAEGFAPRTTVRWIGRIPAEVELDVKQSAVDIVFETDATASEKALTAKSEQLFDALIDAKIDVLSTAPDSVEQRIIVAVAPTASQGPMLAELNQIIADFGTSSIPIEMSVVRTAAGAFQASTAYGGTAAVLSGTSQHKCTMAFAVRRGNIYGLLSAGHCPNNLDYVDPSSGTTSALTLVREYEGHYGDYAWYSTTGSVAAQFHTSSHASGRRYVTSIKSADQINIGDTYCFYGRATNRPSCGTVKYNNTCHRGGDHDVCNQVRVRNVYGRYGDSGGPWYVGAKAVGVHTGCFGSGCGNNTTRQDQGFTPVSLVEDGLGVTVITR